MNTDDTATASPDEHQAEVPAADSHPHAPAAPPEPAHEPAAEAPVESVVETVAEHTPEPTAPADEAATEVPPDAVEPKAEDDPAAKAAKRPKKPKAAPVVAAMEAESEPAATDAAEPAETPDPAETPEVTEPTGTVEPAEGPPAEPVPENKKKWYAIKVQSGREDTIKAAILRKVAIEGLEDVFGQIMIPFEEEIVKKTVRVKDKKTGEYTTQEKKVTRKKKKFQGYLFAELEFNDRILYLFRETSGVGDFLNLRGTPPVPEPMPEHEVQSMLTGVKHGDPLKKGSAKVKLDFEKGDRVRIRDGSFANQEGEVKLITEPKDPTDTPKVTVVVTLWGRPVDVDLDYWQVEKA